MGLQYNGTNIYGVNYNGTSLTQVNFDGVPVWYALTAVTISGVNKVGYEWTAKTTPTEVQNLCTYQWYRGGIAISGATKDTYTTTVEDRGYQLSCIAKIGSASATSNLSLVILQDVENISLSGVLEEDYTLSISIVPTTAVGTYQWYRDDEEIEGATNSSYTLTHDDATHYVKCVFVANGNYSGSLEIQTAEKIVGWFYNSGKAVSLSTSSDSDWFETSWYTFKLPIVPEKSYAYFTYNYYSPDGVSTSTSMGGGLMYKMADSATGGPSAGVGTNVVGRPSSGTASKTTTFTASDIAWFKAHGGIISCAYNGGGGRNHWTQYCGGYIQGYWERRQE